MRNSIRFLFEFHVKIQYSTEFVSFVVSVIGKGSFDEKLRWVFNLYDLNGDGNISRDEMTEIVTSLYDMVGKKAFPLIDEDTAADHTERIFQVSIDS